VNNQGQFGLFSYCKYGISYRELQEMLAERGVNVDHTAIYRGTVANRNLSR
jgi:transposase-like protein